MVNERSRSEFDRGFHFHGDTWFPGAETAAFGLILFSLFLMPQILRFIPGMTMEMVIDFHLFPGILALSFFNWKKLPLRQMKWKEIGEVCLLLVLIQLINAAVTPHWLMLLEKFGFEGARRQVIVEKLREISGIGRLFCFFSVCVLTPLVEELLFRRIIYGWLCRISKVFAFAAASVLFSLAHFYLPGVPGLILLGMGFQFVYLRQRNLTAAVLLHGLNNAMTFLILI